MSQFGPAGSDGTMRRERGFAPRPFQIEGLRGTLDTPGLDVVGVDDPAAENIDNLARALGFGAAIAGSYIDAHNAELNRRVAERELEDRKNESVWKGRAQLQAINDLPSLDVAIANGDIAPDDYTRIPAQTERIIADRMAAMANHPEVYREAYAKELRGHLNGALTASWDRRTQGVLKENAAARALTIVNAGSVEEIQAALAEQRTEATSIESRRGRGALFESPEAIEANTLLFAGKLAAEKGDVAKAEMIASLLGPANADDAMKLVRDATLMQNQATSQARRASEDALSNSVAAMQLDGAPESVIRKHVLSLRGQGDTGPDDTTINAQIQASHERERSGERKATKAELDRFFNDEQAKVVNQLIPLLDAGDVNGGAAFMEDVEIPMPDGSTRTLSAKDQAAAAISTKLEQIDRVTQDPAQRLAQRVEFFQKNPTLANPEWTNTLAGASVRFGVDTNDANMQAAAERAYTLYEHLQAVNPGLVDTHTNESDKFFLDATRFFRRSFQDMSVSAAMSAVRKSSSDPAFRDTLSRELPRKELEKATKQYMDAGNGVEAMGTIERKARAYMALGRVANVEQAVEQAAAEFERDHVKMNNHWVRSSPILKSIDADEVSNLIVGYYVSGREGEDAKNYALTNNGGRWEVSFQGTGYTAPGSPVFSDADLARIHGSLRGAESETLRRERLQKMRADQADRAAMSRRQFRDAPVNAGVFRPAGGRMVDVISVSDDPGVTDLGPISALPEAPDDAPHLKALFEYLNANRKPAGYRRNTSPLPAAGSRSLGA